MTACQIMAAGTVGPSDDDVAPPGIQLGAHVGEPPSIRRPPHSCSLDAERRVGHLSEMGAARTYREDGNPRS
jgi:hypothetical protein